MNFNEWTWGVAAAVAIWATGAAAGTVVATQALGPLVSEGTASQSIEKVVEAKTTDEVPPRRLYLGIAGRNLSVYIWLLCGLVSGGLTTIALLAFNGVALGQVAGFALGAGMPVERLALLTLPHAVPEIGAFLLAGAIGLRGPTLLSAWLDGAFSPAPFTAIWRPAAWGAAVIVAAAAIETFVTVPIAKAGFGS